jgi:hypothetical protein
MYLHKKVRDESRKEINHTTKGLKNRNKLGR